MVFKKIWEALFPKWDPAIKQAYTSSRQRSILRMHVAFSLLISYIFISEILRFSEVKNFDLSQSSTLPFLTQSMNMT